MDHENSKMRDQVIPHAKLCCVLVHSGKSLRVQVIEFTNHLLSSLVFDSLYKVHYIVRWTAAYINVRDWT